MRVLRSVRLFHVCLSHVFFSFCKLKVKWIIRGGVSVGSHSALLWGKKRSDLTVSRGVCSSQASGLDQNGPSELDRPWWGTRTVSGRWWGVNPRCLGCGGSSRRSWVSFPRCPRFGASPHTGSHPRPPSSTETEWTTTSTVYVNTSQLSEYTTLKLDDALSDSQLLFFFFFF